MDGTKTLKLVKSIPNNSFKLIRDTLMDIGKAEKWVFSKLKLDYPGLKSINDMDHNEMIMRRKKYFKEYEKLTTKTA